jgi:hypothetical protein
MSMSSKVCSLSCSDRRSVSRDAVHDDRNSSKRTHIATPVVAFSILPIIAIESFPILAIIMGTTIGTNVVTAISSSVWCSGSCSSCGPVGGEVGGFSGSDLRGVVDWQGCSVGNPCSVGVTEAKVSWTGIHHTGSREAEEQDLKDRKHCCSGISTVCSLVYLYAI